MAVPATRADFKDFCLRKLGKGVIEINVSDDQVDDRLDEALNFWYDFHYDGTERYFYKHVVTQTDKDNQYITMPENVRGVVKIFNVGTSGSTGSNLFNARYQLALNDMHNLTSTSLTPYYMNMQNIALMEEILVGKQPIRYTRYVDKLYVDMDWDKFAVGEYLIAEAYGIVDPETYTDAYNDLLLQRYCTALIKIQWGENLKKFQGMQMPGGMVMDGMSIYNEGLRDKEMLEAEIRSSYNVPSFDMIG